MSVPWYLMAKGKGGGGYKTASGPIVSINDALAAPLRSLLVGIEPVQSGSGDPSPDNVRPISGWSAVNVWRTGVNVWDEEWVLGYWNHSNNGAFVSNNNFFACKNKIKVLPNTTYYWVSPSVIREMLFYDSNENLISYSPYSAVASSLLMTPDKCQYITFYYATAYGTTYNHDISINYPSTDHDYHPYTGNEYTIQLGDTVYGGTLDVLTGVLTVDRAMVDLGTLSWSQNDKNYYYASTSETFAESVRNGVFLCENYKPTSLTYYSTMSYGSVCINQGSKYIFVNVSTAPTGLIVGELATPITIPLTAQEISTLKGENVVWADCGEVEVEYLAAGGTDPDLMKLAVAFMGKGVK